MNFSNYVFVVSPDNSPAKSGRRANAALVSDSPQKEEYQSNGALIHNDFSSSSSMDRTITNSNWLPPDFNPRKEKNMANKEKVNAWVEKMPKEPDRVMHSAAFDENYDEIEMPACPDSDEIYEVQSRKITHLVIRSYSQEKEKIVDPEELARRESEKNAMSEEYSYVGDYTMNEKMRKRKIRKQCT